MSLKLIFPSFSFVYLGFFLFYFYISSYFPYSLQIIQLVSSLGSSEKLERSSPLKHNLTPMGIKAHLICMQKFIVTRKISWNTF